MLDLIALAAAVQQRWSARPSAKAQGYIGQFFETSLLKTKISAKVQGNHGVYRVSLALRGSELEARCSCYIGADGYCHHAEALAHSFLSQPEMFREQKEVKAEKIRTLDDLEAYLQGITLDELLKQLKAKGISQKALAKSIGMSTQHLAAVKSSELKNRYFHELGATKLACLWVLEHLTKA
ncbi:MAG: hypothetical protein KC422_17790 [Trueperaceae bacterium]|nr:hypothetical protein [Trueperaceae bacterium]